MILNSTTSIGEMQHALDLALIAGIQILVIKEEDNIKRVDSILMPHVPVFLNMELHTMQYSLILMELLLD
jgi:hypothetical protein